MYSEGRVSQRSRKSHYLLKARAIQIYKEKYCRGNEGEKCEKRSLKKKMRSFVGFNDDRLMNLCRRKPKYENGFLRMRKTVKKRTMFK